MIKELDGIRAVALVLVVNFHIGMYIGWIPGLNAITGTGYLGVQIFFFLSSLLLSRQFLKNYYRSEHKMLYVLQFYKKRILRIYPLFLASSLVLFLMDYNESFKVPYTWQNVAMYVTFIKDLKINPVIWSLFVEMHFYLILPVIMHVICLLQQKSAKLIPWILAILFATVYGYRCLIYANYAAKEAEDILYISFIANADCFLLGISIALLYEKYKGKNLANSKLWRVAQLGLLVVVFACMYFRFYNMINIEVFRSTYVIHNMAWAALTLLLLLAPHGLFNRLLNSKVMVQLSLLSYSIYLWHYPIHVYWLKHFNPSGNTALNSLGQFVLTWVVSILVSILSYRLVELPFLKRKEHIPLTVSNFG